MQKNVSHTYQLSLADVKEAIEQYMETKGEFVDVTTMEAVMSNYIFNGLKIKAEMV